MISHQQIDEIQEALLELYTLQDDPKAPEALKKLKQAFEGLEVNDIPTIVSAGVIFAMVLVKELTEDDIKRFSETFTKCSLWEQIIEHQKMSDELVVELKLKGYIP